MAKRPCVYIAGSHHRKRVDLCQFFRCECRVFQCLDVVEDLCGLGRADQHRRHCAIFEDPCERHLGEGLTPSLRDLVEPSDALDLLRRQAALLEESAVCANAAVLRNSIEIAVRQDALRKRRKADDAFAEPGSCLFEPIFSTVRSKIL